MSFLRVSFCWFIHLSLTIAAVIKPVAQLSIRKDVCYGDLGCFNRRTGFEKFPESPEKVNTKFFLYTRERHTSSGELISVASLGSFKPNKPIKVIIHGFFAKASSKWVIDMKNELLKSEDMNVIAVDWSGGNGWPYPQAVANTVIVAAATGRLLQAMITRGAKPQQMHLIGHSLGAHVSGYIGRGLRNLGRISGLDPAGPHFYGSISDDRLDSTDALFVDVIHTDGGGKIWEGFGYSEQLGHVDFYPNGGVIQPSCGEGGTLAENIYKQVQSGISIIANLWNDGELNIGDVLDIMDAPDSVACNHKSAVLYYISSINTHLTTVAYPCKNYGTFKEGECTSCGSHRNRCQQLGYHASPNRTLGTLYLKTLDGAQSPYFGTHLKVTVIFDTDYEEEAEDNIFVWFSNHRGTSFLLFNENTEIVSYFENSQTIVVASDAMPSNEIRLSYQTNSNVDYDSYELPDEWDYSWVKILDIQSNRSYKFCPELRKRTSSGAYISYRLCA